jgi:hypothetical protein
MRRLLLAGITVFIFSCENLWATELVNIKARGFDQAMIASGQVLARKKELYLVPTQLAFNQQWLNDHRISISIKEREALAVQYANLMDESLKKRLVARGFTLASAPGPDNLVLTPRISGLFINAPDLSVGINKTFVRVAGHGRVDFTLTQADGTVLAQLSDFSQTDEHGASNLTQTNRGINLRDFRQLMERWSDRLGQFLLTS